MFYVNNYHSNFLTKIGFKNSMAHLKQSCTFYSK
uniref:Uncharacterized protein n=1 Tax=Anguilla anguilla TaxID=7936 RepID=A0A0E9PQP4_ANGAN